MDTKNIKFRVKMLAHHGKHLLKGLLGIKPPPPPANFEQMMAIAEHGPEHPATLCTCKCTYSAPPDQHDRDCKWLKEMCMCCGGNGWCPHCMGDGTNPKGEVDVIG